MEIPKVENISSIRAYAFDYIVGVVWLAAFALYSVTTLAEIATIFAVDCSSVQNNSHSVPEFAQGLLVTIGGVLLPYAIATILKPISLRVMSLFLALQRRLTGRGAKPEMLRGLAADEIRESLGIPSDVAISLAMQHAFLQVHNSSLSLAASKWEEDLYFRVTLIIPSALTISALVLHMTKSHPLAGATGALVVVFGFGSWLANRAFDNYIDCLDFATLAAARFPKGKTEEHK